MKTKVMYVALACILVSVLIVLEISRRSRKRSVVVAICSSLTGSLAANGKDMANGAALAFEELDQAGGVNGLPLRVEMYDDQGDPKVAASIASRISQDRRIIAVVGHLTSGASSAAAPIYSRSHTPIVMPVPTNPEITQQGWTNVFRIPPTDADQAPFLAKYVLSKHPGENVAIVNDLTAYGVGFAKEFRSSFEKGGGKVVVYEGIQKEARDFRTLITKIGAIGPKNVVLGATYDMGAPFVRQMKEQGVDARVIAGDGCFAQDFIELADTAAEGAIVSFIAPDQEFSGSMRDFYRKYEQRYGSGVVNVAPLGYDAAQVVISALKGCKTITRNSLLNEIRSPGFHIAGITGNINFASNGDNENKNLVLYVVSNGRFKSLR